jgi:hypothetical protein
MKDYTIALQAQQDYKTITSTHSSCAFINAAKANTDDAITCKQNVKFNCIYKPILNKTCIINKLSFPK